MKTEKTILRDTYKHIEYELVKWRKGEYGPNYNYYICFREDQFSESFESIWLPVRGWLNSENRCPYYDYTESPLSDLDWHGGISYFQKHINPDTGFRYVEAGCDYGHIWDAGRKINFTLLEVDAKRTIDRVWDVFKSVGVKCSCDGKYYDLSDMVMMGKEGVTDQICFRGNTSFYTERGFEILEVTG